MLNNNNLIVLVIIGVVIYFMFFYKKNTEGYRDISPTGIPVGRLIRRRRHVMMSPTNRIERIQYRPPDYDDQMNNCVHINCPPVFESDVVCWKCKSVSDPTRENMEDAPKVNFFTNYTSAYE